MITQPGSATFKPSKRRTIVLGRSVATGCYVLAPASKPGPVTLEKARMAVAHVLKSKCYPLAALVVGRQNLDELQAFQNHPSRYRTSRRQRREAD